MSLLRRRAHRRETAELTAEITRLRQALMDAHELAESRYVIVQAQARVIDAQEHRLSGAARGPLGETAPMPRVRSHPAPATEPGRG